MTWEWNKWDNPDIRKIYQGKVYMTDLKYDSIENEESGYRPVIVISTDKLNKKRDNVVIAPITSSIIKKDMINHYFLYKEKYKWLSYDKNIVLLECPRDISKKRLGKCIGKIDDRDLKAVLKLLNFTFNDIKLEENVEV